MRKAYLIRTETGPHGTFGIMVFGGKRVFSGELQWLGNKANVSCIPAGEYTCRWTYSPAFKRMMYLVENVKGRSGIRIHSANYMGSRAAGLRCHLYGCIAFGRSVGVMDGQRALLRSRPAVGDVERWAQRQPFKLEIIDGFSR